MICSIKRLRAEANNRALFDISAVLLDGRCCTIYGPSGIGKSTFLRGLANGHADGEVKGIKFSKLLKFNGEIANIRYIAQHPPRFEFTVDKFFKKMLVANHDCIGCDDTLQDIIEAFDLTSILLSSMMQISGGQLHRVHLAAALASSAELLLLDEPTAALDRSNSAILMRLLREFIANRNGYIICCTHDPNFLWESGNEPCWNSVEFPTFVSIKPPNVHHVI
ncbi:tungstate transport system ATP-binding protein [Loktanella ponticola]|uniref:Tungstate transport system ATP-binding protein n=1 Tax=Yoonia ponticola TaxID=1524255 RepID=A0A7W9BJJ8_9RHOB|nr:ATP-binding cassette domain-containing protein [Yoonia ponticola]MBB5721412.1 tungstate transport system ATP-binding protein [Yoonia ponticola]